MARRRKTPGGLTAGEWRVAKAIARGRSDTEAGADLGISAGGVRFHLCRINKKHGFSNRVELATAVVRAEYGDGPLASL